MDAGVTVQIHSRLPGFEAPSMGREQLRPSWVERYTGILILARTVSSCAWDVACSGMGPGVHRRGGEGLPLVALAGASRVSVPPMTNQKVCTWKVIWSL